MHPYNRSISVILICYLFFGLFNLAQHRVFLVPVSYNALFMLALTLTLFVQPRSSMRQPQIFLLSYAILSVLVHPFLWELFMSQAQQNAFFGGDEFFVLKIMQYVVLIVLTCVAYRKFRHRKLDVIWLLPILTCVFGYRYFPQNYETYTFLSLAFSAFYSLLILKISDYHSSQRFMILLMAIGFLQLMTFVY